MEEYKWQKRYLKEGMRALDNLTINDLLNVKALYKTVHLPFVEQLEQSFPSNTDAGKLLGELKKNLLIVIGLIGRVASSAGRRAKKEELDKLFSAMERINPQINQLSELADDYADLRERMVKAQESLDTTTEDLKSAHETVSGYLKGVRTKKGPGHRGWMRALGAPFWQIGVSTAKRAYYRSLGYGTTTALAGVGATFGGIVRGISEGSRIRKRTLFEEALPGYGVGRGEVGLGVPPAATLATIPPAAAPITGLPGIQTPVARGGAYGKRDLRYEAMPMWYFFHHLAHKAKWTRDVLRLLKGKTIGGVEGTEVTMGLGGKALESLESLGGAVLVWIGIKTTLGKISGLLGKGGPIVGVLGKGVAISLAAGLGWKLGSWIDKHTDLSTILANAFKNVFLGKTETGFLPEEAILSEEEAYKARAIRLAGERHPGAVKKWEKRPAWTFVPGGRERPETVGGEDSFLEVRKGSVVLPTGEIVPISQIPTFDMIKDIERLMEKPSQELSKIREELMKSRNIAVPTTPQEYFFKGLDDILRIEVSSGLAVGTE